MHERCFFLMKLNLFAMQKTYFHVLEHFCRVCHVRASMHKITSLELLRTLMLCLVQLSKRRDSKATDAAKASFSVRESWFMQFLGVKLKYMKMFYFLMKLNVIWNAEDRFSCLDLFAEVVMFTASIQKNH